jgi:hypothetical protein
MSPYREGGRVSRESTQCSWKRSFHRAKPAAGSTAGIRSYGVTQRERSSLRHTVPGGAKRREPKAPDAKRQQGEAVHDKEESGYQKYVRFQKEKVVGHL